MRALREAVRRRLDRVTNNDSGFTMIEVVVVMVIMAVVLVIFTAGAMQAFSAENKVDTAASAENQIVVAFQRLDKELRYANAISTPGTQSGDPVVEFLSPNLNDTNSTCTEVRLHTSTGQLQQRTWTRRSLADRADGLAAVGFIARGGHPVDAASASSPVNVAVVAPFAVIDPGATFVYQRIEVAVSVTYGVNANKTTKQSDVTFTAINSTSAVHGGQRSRRPATAAEGCHGEQVASHAAAQARR